MQRSARALGPLVPFATLSSLILLAAPLACASGHATTPPAQLAAAPSTPRANDPAPAQPGARAPSTGGPATAAAAPSQTGGALPSLPGPNGQPAPSAASAQPAPTAAAAESLPNLPNAQPAPIGRILIVDDKPFVGAAPMPARSGQAHAAAGQGQGQGHGGAAHGRQSTRHPASRRPAGRHHRDPHPEPRIVVEVVDATGGVSKADVQRDARAHGWMPIRNCYLEGQRRDARLSGRASFELAVASDGTASPASRGTTLRDESVAACVAREVSHLSLFKPEQAGAVVSFRVTLSPGDNRPAAPSPAHNADRLRETLRDRWSGVEVCYREGLGRKRDIGGRLEVKMKLRPSGEVAEASEGDTHFADGDVSRCVVDLLKNTRFRAFRGHEDESFVYALHLESVVDAKTRDDARADDDANDTRDER